MFKLQSSEVKKDPSGQIMLAQPNLRRDLDQKIINQEMYRKLTIECGKRCMDYESQQSGLTNGEKLCLNRCASKFMQLKTVVHKKIEYDERVEMPPILYGQNISYPDIK